MFQMLLHETEEGKAVVALIQLDDEHLDISKRIPKPEVTLPFPGLFTFIQK